MEQSYRAANTTFANKNPPPEFQNNQGNQGFMDNSQGGHNREGTNGNVKETKVIKIKSQSKILKGLNKDLNQILKRVILKLWWIW